MSSRDGSNRTGGRRPSPQSGREANPSRQSPRSPRANWDVDPAEIDRYLSGRPSREQESQGTTGRARPQPRTTQGTASQLDQLQRARGSQPTPRPTSRPTAQPQRETRPASVGRQQFVEPENTGAYYDDPIDDDAASVGPAQGYDVGYDEEHYAPVPAPAPQPRRQRSQPRQAQPARQQQPAPRRRPAYDEEYDDELYADDPYLTYDDEGDWEAPAPRRTSRPRPQVKLSKPNLPKLTLPPAISRAELANDIPALSMIGGAILSVAIMAIVVSNRLDVLSLTIPTHVSASGVPENLQGREAIWSLPLLASALSLMNIAAAWFFARIDMFAARFMLGAALLVQFIAWIAVLKYLWP